MSRKIIFIAMIVLSFSSCKEIATEVKNWIEIENAEDIVGAYHYLENDGIKIYLPEVFQRYSSVEYEKILDSLATKDQFEFEKKRLKNMRDIKGSLYIYFDDFSRSTYTINTIPYQPLYKRDAQLILGMIRKGQEQLSDNSDFKFEKITAKYNSDKNIQLFKAIYKVSNPKQKTTVFNSTYIVSSKDKTVIINLTTGTQVDFDIFLQKMIL